MRVHYMKQAEWEEDWIDTAIEIAVDIWTNHYKLDNVTPTEEDVSPGSQFGYSVCIVYSMNYM
jgi:hypothetical protein